MNGESKLLLARLENEQTESKDENTVKVEPCFRLKPAILEAKANTIEIKNAQPASTEVKRFELSNIGSGPLHAQIATTKPWLSVIPDSATIAPSMRKTFVVRIGTKHLPLGFIDRDFIIISTNGGNTRLPVNLSIASAYNPVKTCEVTSSTFSLKRFLGALLWFILVPASPPVLLLISVLFASFGHDFVFKSSLGVYIFVAFVVAYTKGVQKREKVHTIPTPQAKPIDTAAGPTKASVFTNKLKGIYHKPWCVWAKMTSSSNTEYLALEEAIRRGYHRCKACRP